MGKIARPTIYEVARQAGVSRQTVSRVINNRPDVAPETRERILHIINELDYRPSAIARSLTWQRTFNFGLLTAGLRYIGPSTTLSGIAKKAEEIGYGIYFKELPTWDSNNIQPILDWFLARQVEGIIWAVPEVGDNHEWIRSVADSIPVPIIFLTTAKRPDISIVSIDNYSGARMATEHLLSVGRRRIGHISGPMDWWESRQRMQGWQDVLREAGIQPEPHMIAEGNWSSKSGKRAFAQLMESFPDMDAVFVANDQMALSVLQTACESRLDIPNALSVVGFDNIPESEFFSPALTTVFQNLIDLGCTAVEELVRMIETGAAGEDVTTPKYLTLQPELIIRKSTSPKA
jgi:LacI family transcriptional regulator